MQQLFFNKAGAGAENARRARQWHDFQTAANFAQGAGYRLQVLTIPLGGDVFNDRVFGVLQPVTRFAQHRFFGAGERNIQIVVAIGTVLLDARFHQTVEVVFDCD